uniref:hypothetical protein n=1 Tax=Ornithobacterium rhinotracheale TaxID=28251 RepID=UPI0039A4D295
MKKSVFSIVLLFVFSLAFGQKNNNYLEISLEKDIEGTDFVLGERYFDKKIDVSDDKILYFINATNGEMHEVNFGEKINVKVEQIKIDSLNINTLIAKTYLSNKLTRVKSSLYLLSTDGREMQKIVDDDFCVKKFVLNKNTGNLVIKGFRDVNENGKIDKNDKEQILIYSLKHKKQISLIEQLPNR